MRLLATTLQRSVTRQLVIASTHVVDVDGGGVDRSSLRRRYTSARIGEKGRNLNGIYITSDEATYWMALLRIAL